MLTTLEMARAEFGFYSAPTPPWQPWPAICLIECCRSCIQPGWSLPNSRSPNFRAPRPQPARDPG